MYIDFRALNFYEQILREMGELNAQGKVPIQLNLTTQEYKILLNDAYRMSKPFDVQDIDNNEFAGMEIQIYEEFDMYDTSGGLLSFNK